MQLYRYRPIGPLLFKELLYREIYMATYSEINDPQDLSCSINFFSTDKEAVNALAYFICLQLIRAHGIGHSAAIYKNKLVTTKILSEYLLSSFQELETREAHIEQLSHLIHRHYESNVDGHFSSLDAPNPADLMSELEKVFGKFLNNSSIACFTNSYNNFLMWSHYAGGHNGVCVGYEVAEEHADRCNITCAFEPNAEGKEIEYKLPINRVNYSIRVPPINFYEFYQAFINEGDIDLMNLSKSRWHPYAEYVESIFLTKLETWAYEKEWRLVNVKFTQAMPEDNMHKYGRDALKTVYFGVNSDVYSQLRIYKILGNDVTYYKCKLNGTNSLDSEELNMDLVLDNYLHG